MEYAEHQQLIVDHIKEDNVRKSGNATIPAAGSRHGKPLWVGDDLYDALTNQIGECIA
jgi:hypothetical protein